MDNWVNEKLKIGSLEVRCPDHDCSYSFTQSELFAALQPETVKLWHQVSVHDRTFSVYKTVNCPYSRSNLSVFRSRGPPPPRRAWACGCGSRAGTHTSAPCTARHATTWLRPPKTFWRRWATCGPVGKCGRMGAEGCTASSASLQWSWRPAKKSTRRGVCPLYMQSISACFNGELNSHFPLLKSRLFLLNGKRLSWR